MVLCLRAINSSRVPNRQSPLSSISIFMQCARSVTDPRHARDCCSASSAGGDSSVIADDKVRCFLGAVSDFSSHRSPCPAASPRPGDRPPVPSLRAYTVLMKAFGRSGLPDEAHRLLLELKSSPSLSPNVFHYNTLMQSFFLSGLPDDAEAMFDEMIDYGITPNLVSFTLLLKIKTLRPFRIETAYKVLEMMREKGFNPDSVAYSPLIDGLCRFGRIAEAVGVLDSMIEKGCSPTIKTYTSILRGYCSQGKIEEAKAWFLRMENAGCCSDTIAYTVLIQGFCKVGNFDEVEMVLRESSSKGWIPNQITYNTYLKGLCKWGWIDEAFRKYEVMRASGLQPDVATLHILFSCLCRDSKFREAMFLLERSHESDWEVDVFFYNALMSRLCDMGFYSSVLKLLAVMLKKGISPDACAITIVIRSLCLLGKFRKATQLIRSHGFVPDIATFNTLIHRLSISGILDYHQNGEEIDYWMCMRDVVPNEVTCCLIMDNFCRRGRFLNAVEYLVKRLKDGFQPELVKRLKFWMSKDRKYKEIDGRGSISNGRIFERMIKGFCRAGFCQNVDMEKVCSTLDEMLDVR